MLSRTLRFILIICIVSLTQNHFFMNSAKADTLIASTSTAVTASNNASDINNLTLTQLVSASIKMPQNGIDVVNSGGLTNNGTKSSSFIPDYTKIYFITDMTDDEAPVYYYKFSQIELGANYPVIKYSGYTRTYNNHTLSAGVPFSININDGDLYKKITGGTFFSGSPKTNSRYQTKRLNSILDIAKLSNPSTGKLMNVILTTGTNFADSLSSTIMASKLQAPILFMNTDNDDATFSYITSQLDKLGTIYILGGTGAISDDTEWRFKLKGYTTVRLDGATRYDTCETINDKFPAPSGNPVIIASGENFPDALSISSISAIKNYPIFLTTQNALPEQTKRLLSKAAPSQIYVIGGPGVISNNVINELQSYSKNITRIYGSDRYETAINICKSFDVGDYDIAVTTGMDFKYALSGSIIAAKYNAPILLVDGDTSKVKQYLDSSKYSNIIILGDTKAVSSDIEKALVQ